MNPSDLESIHRRSIRLNGYDYSEQGAYFVTLCADRKRPVFGEIRKNAMSLNAYGTIIRDCWLETPSHRPYVSLDEFVVMPNHFHAIVVLNPKNAPFLVNPPDPNSPTGLPPQSIGALMGAFKSAATRQINKYRQDRDLPPVKVWQRNYFERIIRTQRELDATRRYIAENPQNWLSDEHHPRNEPR